MDRREPMEDSPMRTPILQVLLLAALPTLAAATLTFEEVDTDGDGLISADEAASVEDLDFNAADGDNDGTLSVDEYDIAVQSLASPTDVAPPTDAAADAAADTDADAEKSNPPAAPSTGADAVKPTVPPTPPKP
jgi:hypothetical protein